jgi:hypothetical protein
VIGAYMTYRFAHKAGSAYLRKQFGHRKVGWVLSVWEKWQTSALVVWRPKRRAE